MACVGRVFRGEEKQADTTHGMRSHGSLRTVYGSAGLPLSVGQFSLFSEERSLGGWLGRGDVPSSDMAPCLAGDDGAATDAAPTVEPDRNGPPAVWNQVGTLTRRLVSRPVMRSGTLPPLDFLIFQKTRPGSTEEEHSC